MSNLELRGNRRVEHDGLDTKLFRRCVALANQIAGGDFRMFQLDAGGAWRVGFGGHGFREGKTLDEALTRVLEAYGK